MQNIWYATTSHHRFALWSFLCVCGCGSSGVLVLLFIYLFMLLGFLTLLTLFIYLFFCFALLFLIDKPVAISWPQRGDISFENVSLRYEGQQEDVIRNLNLKIPAGQRVSYKMYKYIESCKRRNIFFLFVRKNVVVGWSCMTKCNAYNKGLQSTMIG